jgi:hypothetical protein
VALPAQPGGASSFGSGLSGLGNGVLSRASLGERLAICRQDSLIRGSNEIRARSGCAAQSDPTTVRPANAAAPQPVLQSVRPTGSAMIATPAMAETTGPTSNTMSTPDSNLRRIATQLLDFLRLRPSLYQRRPVCRHKPARSRWYKFTAADRRAWTCPIRIGGPPPVGSSTHLHGDVGCTCQAAWWDNSIARHADGIA